MSAALGQLRTIAVQNKVKIPALFMVKNRKEDSDGQQLA